MNDLISRQALCKYALNQKDKSVTPNDIMRFPSAESEQIVRDIATIIENEKDMRVILKNAEPEHVIPLSWIETYIEWLKGLDNAFSKLTALQIEVMVKKWRGEQDG